MVDSFFSRRNISSVFVREIMTYHRGVRLEGSITHQVQQAPRTATISRALGCSSKMATQYLIQQVVGAHDEAGDRGEYLR